MNEKPTALVTGGSRGIGRGIALALGRSGFNVVINYASNAEAASAVAKEIESTGGSALISQADISLATDREKLVREAIEKYGSIDVLVNNAGVAPNVRADLLEAGEASFDRLININLKGPYFLTQQVARIMIDRKKERFAPKIITISSISAYTASVNRGDYCIAKAGLSMMTQLFAARLAEAGIGVYEIRPGIIQTDMTGPVKAKYDKMIFEEGITPIRRWGQPQDIAAAVVAIANDAFPFSTGEAFNIDGGFHMRTL